MTREYNPVYQPPAGLPSAWRRAPGPPDQYRFENRRSGLRVIISVDRIGEIPTLHLSVSRRSRTPNWSDLRAVKNLFIGPEQEAHQIMPPESQYVNLHPYCMHLWAAMTPALEEQVNKHRAECHNEPEIESDQRGQ